LRSEEFLRAGKDVAKEIKKMSISSPTLDGYV